MVIDTTCFETVKQCQAVMSNALRSQNRMHQLETISLSSQNFLSHFKPQQILKDIVMEIFNGQKKMQNPFLSEPNYSNFYFDYPKK